MARLLLHGSNLRGGILLQLLLDDGLMRLLLKREGLGLGLVIGVLAEQPVGAA